MITLLVTYVGAGLLLALLSVPLIQKRIGPNNWYGVRIPQTLNNPEVWYDVNAFVAWRLFAVGILMIVAAIGLSFVSGLNVGYYAIGCALIVFVGFIITAFQTVLHLLALRRK